MRISHLLGLPLGAALSVGASGCGEDLGTCNEAEARRLIINNEGVLYAGQALLNGACASGQCHASSAEGDLRGGAPAGLDFELFPAGAPGTGAATATSGSLTLDAKQLSRLRRNQRLVFDERELIWQQIKDDLMPPGGIGQPFRDKSPGNEANLAAPCQVLDALPPIDSAESREILRNWLACGAPVVEATSDQIPDTVISQDPAGIAGTVGQQMPLCVDLGECGNPITFDDLYAAVFQPSCVTGCHQAGGIYPDFNLGDLETAYTTLTTASTACNGGSPMVVPGDAASSYLVTKMGGSTNLQICGGLMPAGATMPLACGVQQLSAWIDNGAPAPGQPAMP